MIIILPLWIVAGRFLFGIAGWISIIFLFTLGPLLLFSLLALRLLAIKRVMPDDKIAYGGNETVLLALIYISSLLNGFFLIDSGDTPASRQSIATVVFGEGIRDVSRVIGEQSFALLIVSTVAALAYFSWMRLRYNKLKKQLPPREK